ncbi:MAG: hypothetical protein JWO26_1903 [Rhodospirillales bacterium]|nr:hypothetical protein [Rhodospirillales bacterium]
MDRNSRPPGARPDTGGLTEESGRQCLAPLLDCKGCRPEGRSGISQEACPIEGSFS